MNEIRACGHCGKRGVVPVVLDYEARRTINGETHQAVLPNLSVTRCSICGTIWLTEEDDTLICGAIMKKAGYLLPEEIKAIRTANDLCIPEMTKIVQMSEEVLVLIEKGYRYQTREQDDRFRLLSRNELPLEIA